GPVLGGFLIELGGLDLGWRLTFLVNVPIGIATIILGLLWFPKPLIRSIGARGAGRAGQLLRALDPVGSVLLGLAVLAVLLPFVEARETPLTWLLLPTSALLFFLWVRWERRYARQGGSPMVDLEIFSTASFTNGITIMALYFLGMTSVWVLVAIYVQEGAGKTALEAAMFGLPAALLSAYAADWAGRRVHRYGRKLVIGGLFLALAGLASSAAVALLYEHG